MFITVALILFFANQPFVYDGDTLYYRKLGLRLDGMNAPEIGQLYAEESKHALAAFLGEKKIGCQTIDQDKYHRLVVRCFAGKQNVSKWMVRNGWAKAYFTKDYIEDEALAKAEHLGIWSKTPPK